MKRIIFWSYERGSWPYDVMVLVIVLFVLVTPRRWFHDQPPSTAAAGADIQLLSMDASSGVSIYRLSARLLPPGKRAAKATPELERETHDILGRSVNDLKDRLFQVQTIRPVGGGVGAVEYYDVEVRARRGP